MCCYYIYYVNISFNPQAIELNFTLSMNFCLSVLTPAVAFPSREADGILSYPYILAISSNISASSVISNLNVGTSNSKISEDTKLHLNSKLSNIFIN